MSARFRFDPQTDSWIVAAPGGVLMYRAEFVRDTAAPDEHVAAIRDHLAELGRTADRAFGVTP